MVKFISLHALDYEHVQYLKNKKTTRSKMRITTLYTDCLFVCLIDLIFTSHQQSFSKIGTGLPGWNQY